MHKQKETTGLYPDNLAVRKLISPLVLSVSRDRERWDFISRVRILDDLHLSSSGLGRAYCLALSTRETSNAGSFSVTTAFSCSVGCKRNCEIYLSFEDVHADNKHG